MGDAPVDTTLHARRHDRETCSFVCEVERSKYESEDNVDEAGAIYKRLSPHYALRLLHKVRTPQPFCFVLSVSRMSCSHLRHGGSRQSLHI